MQNADAKLHNSTMFDWNDLRHFLAVARHGSTLAAAKTLRVSQSTVHRRLEELERRIGRKLVKRHPTGYRLTEFGEEMLAHAERVEDSVAAFERHTAASVRELKGSIRVTCPEGLGSSLVRSTLLDKFSARFPELRVELVMTIKILDLGKGQADIAIRAAAPADESLVGRKIGDSLWAVYASRAYVKRHGGADRIADIDRHAIVQFDGDMADSRAAKWLQSVAPRARVAARSNSLSALVLAVKSGAGLAVVPVIVGENERDLVRVLGPIDDLTTPYYLLMHQDMRRTPRVRAFFDFVVDELGEFQKLLMRDLAVATYPNRIDQNLKAK